MRVFLYCYFITSEHTYACIDSVRQRRFFTCTETNDAALAQTKVRNSYTHVCIYMHTYIHICP